MLRVMPGPSRLAPLLALAVAACGGEPELAGPPAPLADPVHVSGASPFAPGCGGPPQRGIRYPGSEVEVSLVVNPANADHLVAAWQQDRWSNGGADGLVAAVSQDGGLTWTQALVPFSLCGGGLLPNGAYERATDPWLTFSADGATVHLVGLAFDASSGARRRAILVSRSGDGGLTWADPSALASDIDPAFALDKPSATADPVLAANVYVVWDRLTGVGGDPAAMTGPAWFSRSTDGGLTWEPPVVLHDPGADAQTISSQIVILPDGTLVNVFVRITSASRPAPLFEVVAMRSSDAGTTWSPPVRVERLLSRGAVDPKTGHRIRAGEVVPSTAVDPTTGELRVAWQDARFSAGARDGIALAASTDGGLTWSTPVQVNAVPAVQAFRPAVAFGRDGAMAVSYYDLRDDVPADSAHTWTTFWRATSADGGATWRDEPEGGPFDLRSAPDSEGWFLGDYTGLVAGRDRFVASFAMSGASTDVFATRPPPSPAGAARVLPSPLSCADEPRRVPAPVRHPRRAHPRLPRRHGPRPRRGGAGEVGGAG